MKIKHGVFVWILFLTLTLAAPVMGATLSWVDNSPDELGFIIYRQSTPLGPFVEVGRTGINITTFVDLSGVKGDCWRVTAFNQNTLGVEQESQPSNHDCLKQGKPTGPSTLGVAP